jgi:hypothetical protein
MVVLSWSISLASELHVRVASIVVVVTDLVVHMVVAEGDSAVVANPCRCSHGSPFVATPAPVLSFNSPYILKIPPVRIATAAMLVCSALRLSIELWRSLYPWALLMERTSGRME